MINEDDDLNVTLYSMYKIAIACNYINGRFEYKLKAPISKHQASVTIQLL